MLPLRIVLDTNVVVSAVLKPAGLERAALTFCLTRPARLCVSPPILDEYRRVLAYPKLKLPRSLVSEFLSLLESRALLINPRRTLTITPDPADNRFLECAEGARADYLISGNLRHFPRFWRSAKIVNAREFLSVIAPHF